MTETTLFIRQLFERGAALQVGVEEVSVDLVGLVPFTLVSFREAKRQQRVASVALLKRVEQSQDVLARLLRALAAWQGQDAATMTQRDLGNFAEKLNAVDSAEDWMAFVRLRNRLVHEYPLDEAEQVARVNACWAKVGFAAEMMERLRTYAASQGLTEIKRS
ncbi:MAG: hypothetical protein E6R12_03595 [Sphingomonadales bacterium]|nr:MAG: hypothetical protein E6R12_03595 [Sphingomonadales bacterium]